MSDQPEQGGKKPIGRMARHLWCAGGFACVALGAIGAVLPGMPTTVFLILALACFDRGSPRFHTWLINHACWGPILREWKENGAVPRRAKWLAAIMMSLSVAVLYLTTGSIMGTTALATLLLVIGTWLWLRPEPAAKVQQD